MRKRKVIAAIVIAAAVALALIWSSVSSTAVEVWVSPVVRGDVEASVANTRAGTVKACRRSRLSMPAGGIVDRLLVSEGDLVEAGQLLLELWNKDRIADVSQAQHTFEAAKHDRKNACLLADHKKREADRIRELRKRNQASEESLDAAVTALASQRQICDVASDQANVAEANLAMRQAVLERTRLHAPFAGIVAEINGEVGEYITPSPPGIPTPAAVDLIDYSCLYVAAPIDEIDASKLRIGQPARVSLDAYRDRFLSGKVSRIAPYVLDLERQARTVEVEVRLDPLPEDISLLVGYSADMTLILEQRSGVLRVPTEALLPDGSVWVVTEGGVLHKQQVEVGIGNWSFTEIRAGLNLGDRVVRSPDLPGIAEGVAAQARSDAIANE